MIVNTNLSMCIVCMLLYLTRNTKSKQNGHSRKHAQQALHSLREIEYDSHRTSSVNVNDFVNQTDRLLEETKRNLILSFGLRKNMVLFNNQIRRREPHNYMLYITEMYKNLTRNGLSSFRNTVRGCGNLGLPIPALVNTVRGCADIGNTNGRLADFPHISFKFDISEIPTSETLIESKLKIMMQPAQVTGRKHPNGRGAYTRRLYKMTLYIVWPKDKSKSNFPRLLKVKSKPLEIIEGQGSRWICFDTSTYLYGIGNKKYMKFVLRVETLGGGKALDPGVLGFSRHDGEDTKKALLVLFTGDQNDSKLENLRKKRGVTMSQSSKREHRRRKKNRRKKKKNNKNKRKRRKKQCRRKTMMVNFKQFQWTNWLVQPEEYNAYHCHGLCKYPVPRHLKSTNHAIIQALVHSNNKNFVPPPCCVPDEFQVLYLLSLDGPDRVVLKRKEGLIAKSCACK